MSHKNFDSLRKAILAKTKKGMKEEVLPNYIEDLMWKATKEEVYDVWNPTKYKRREENGGLLDRDNIRGKVLKSKSNGFTFKVENIARTNFESAISPRIYLAPLVIMGKKNIDKSNVPARYNYWQGAEIYSYGEDRDFIGETKNNLDKSKIAQKLDNYMRKT